MPVYFTLRVIPRLGKPDVDVDVFLISSSDPQQLTTLDSLSGHLPRDVEMELMLHPDKMEAIKQGQRIGIERGWQCVGSSID
jgi:hypothetical protein